GITQISTRRILGVEYYFGIIEELNRSSVSVMGSLQQRAGVTIIEDRRTVVVEEAYRESSRSCAERQSAPVGVNTCDFPSADDGVHPTGRVPSEPASAAERKLINPVYIDDVPDVEIGVPTTHTEIAEVADQPTEHRVHDTRLIINRMREGVVEVELQAPRESLPQA